MDKVMYQVVDKCGKNIIPIDWNNLPNEVVDKIDDSLIYDILGYSKEEGIITKTVVFFKQVEKFGKKIKSIESEDVIFGV